MKPLSLIALAGLLAGGALAGETQSPALPGQATSGASATSLFRIDASSPQRSQIPGLYTHRTPSSLDRSEDSIQPGSLSAIIHGDQQDYGAYESRALWRGSTIFTDLPLPGEICYGYGIARSCY